MFEMSPVIVYVLPVPVWPYAKMVQLKPPKTWYGISRAASDAAKAMQTYFVQNGSDDLVEDHALVGGGREDLVELVRLVAEGARSHGKVHGASLDSVGGDDDARVLLDLAVIAASTTHDNVDVGLLLGLELALFALDAGRRRGADCPRRGNRLGSRGAAVLCWCRGSTAGEVGSRAHCRRAHG